MSAPPPFDHPTMPTMVSRLPKFSSRPRSQTTPAAAATSTTRLTNGFYHHPGPAEVNGTTAAPPSSAKQNGFIRVPASFSMKLRKENGMVEDGGADGETEWRRGKGGNVVQSRSNFHQYYSQRQQGPPVLLQHDAKKPAMTGKGRVPSAASSPSPQSTPRTLPVSKTGSRSSKPSQSGLTNGTKHTLHEIPGSKSRSGTESQLRRPQSFSRLTGPGSGLGSRAGSPSQKKSPANRSHSSESLGCLTSVQLTENDRFRSRSLTQVRQQPSPTLTLSPTSSPSLPRSPSTTHSSNRAAQRRSPTSSRQDPLKASLLGSPTGKAGGGRVTGKSGVSVPSLLPPSALKKPLLLSSGVSSRPSGISYKLSRPSLIKQSRPLRVTPANLCGGDQKSIQAPNRRRDSLETPSSTENSPEAPETEGLSADPGSHGEASIVGETLEDMSLSSTSSLDRNDISQEYMDDFDNLGNGGVGLLLLSSKNDEDDSGLDQSCTRFDDVQVNRVAKATALCFVDDGTDWTGVGERGDHHLSRLSRQRRSSQPDYHDQGGSSLDLSPSDSCGSGGTYMWDEEGLETLGGVATTTSIHTNSNTTHHIGSFDSDINSIDLLNNLDSCDLADDDLMLDADFPEDASLHSDSDGLPLMAQWRRRQLCWGTQDVHNDNESDIQCYKLAEDPGNKKTDMVKDGDLILDLCPARSTCLSPGTPSLGLDVEELAEDCCAVRSQLEFLQRLLLQEEDVDDDTLTTDTLSPETDSSSHSSDSQVQVLLQEVQQLREELRSRDRTIAQLTLQLTVPTVTNRCCCQETAERTNQHTQTSVRESESVALQTPWREHTSQVLHTSGQEDQEPLTDSSPPPSQAPPPGNATQPRTPADRLLRSLKINHAVQRGGHDGKVESSDRCGTFSRSLLPPQSSKLRLFLPHISSSVPNSPKMRASRQRPGPRDPDGSAAAGTKLKAPAFTSSSSRLPKPKSH
ncbi:serine-rich coiled-coil domain-containing protein 2-like isoform X2 [Melanotaenia boesemani]|uniref:serine-rich coiled-coil domain-containing protein 2-like isoform X2 n=1 Tax=Melanotaenia boesemani TaxID=1250792 RepID=UPI001C0502E7|nr:serine-rich coiled-coil domain-containing protein 2-like isoform X2 [Melanotaenia boesemani]